MAKYLVEIKETYYATVWVDDTGKEPIPWEIIQEQYDNDELELEFDTGDIVNITKMEE